MMAIAGIWSEAVLEFPKQCPSHQHEPSGTLMSNCDRNLLFERYGLPQTTEASSPGISACSIESYLEDDEEVGNNLETEPFKEECIARGLNLHSVADLVDNLQDKVYNVRENCQKIPVIC